jgi:PadR family transcriptional regulator PadR
MPRRENSAIFMNGIPELMLLRLLKNREMYGYELVQAIQDETAEVIVLGEGVVYPVLHGLERDGALKSRRKSVNGRSRVYYSITAAGQRRLGDLTDTWMKLNHAVQGILTGARHVPAV